MVISRISPGLANALMEYAAGYALARELNQELVLDLSECKYNAFAYLLDFFQIKKCKKILYPIPEGISDTHTDLTAIAPQLWENSIVLVEEEPKSIPNGMNVVKYVSLNSFDKDVRNDNYYLCGYFFNIKFYKKYFKEICEQFKIINGFSEIIEFEKMIRDRVSVGVHIRRGDMLYAGWALRMEDAYYRAAIEWYRRHFKYCVFFVFSDDIEYAQLILGKAEDINYIDFLGLDEADFMEFSCLSMCRHRVFSNSSTFSRLADMLNGKKGRCIVDKWAFPIKFSVIIDKYGKKFAIELYVRSFLSRRLRCFVEKKSNARRISLTKNEIERLENKYNKEEVEKKSINQFKNILEKDCTCENAMDILHDLAVYSLNVIGVSDDIKLRLLRKKMQALYMLKEYDRVLGIAYLLYYYYKEEPGFLNEYIEALLISKYWEEAAVEIARIKSKNKITEKQKFALEDQINNLISDLNRPQMEVIIIAESEAFPSSDGREVMRIAEVFYHLGHKVTVVFNEENEVSIACIRKSPKGEFINSVGARYGITVYLKNDVLKGEGVKEFVNRMEDESLYGTVVFIGCDEKFLNYVKKGIKVPYQFSSACSENYKMETGNWNFGKSHRLSVKHIKICRSILKRCILK